MTPAARLGREQFASRLRSLLLRADIPDNAPELAAHINERFPYADVPVDTARQWLAGDELPTPGRLYQLAHILGVSAYWLRHGNQNTEGAST